MKPAAAILLMVALLLPTLVVDPAAARIRFMTKLKLLALLAMTKKVQVVPFPLPIPIPIQLSGKDEFYYVDPPMPPPSPYYGPPLPPLAAKHHMGYSASELFPVAMEPDHRHPPLRYGDRITANKSAAPAMDPGATYRIRKVIRNRPPEPSNAAATTVMSPTTTPMPSAAITESTSTTTEMPQLESGQPDQLKLKDIKLIFIPVKNMALDAVQDDPEKKKQPMPTGLAQSDMHQLSQQVAQHLNSPKMEAMPPAAPTPPPPPPPPPSTSSVSAFPLSLQARWQQQNSNAPRVPYYRAPELKVIRTRPYDPSQEYASQMGTTSGRAPPPFQPNNLQFLYQVSHQQYPSPPAPLPPPQWSASYHRSPLVPGASTVRAAWAEPPWHLAGHGRALHHHNHHHHQHHRH